MAAMVRKQVYIEERQERVLKRISKTRGVSEAELIRRAIDRETTEGKSGLFQPDPAAWDRILLQVNKRVSSAGGGRPYQWNRLEIYEKREEYGKRRGKRGKR